MGAIRITENREREKAFKAALKQMNNTVSVGIHQADGDQIHKGSNDTTVLDVAIWNEFGTRNMPARSFLRAWFDQNKARAQEAFIREAKLVAEGKVNVRDALDRFGRWVVGQIQAHIATSIPPPNAASTVARKGSSTTLIDTGQLRSSITHKVHTNQRT